MQTARNRAAGDLFLGSQPAGKNITGVKMMTISPGTVTGHAAAGGAIPADVKFSTRRRGRFWMG
jgi:hypothetical protein